MSSVFIFMFSFHTNAFMYFKQHHTFRASNPMLLERGFVKTALAVLLYCLPPLSVEWLHTAKWSCASLKDFYFSASLRLFTAFPDLLFIYTLFCPHHHFWFLHSLLNHQFTMPAHHFYLSFGFPRNQPPIDIVLWSDSYFSMLLTPLTTYEPEDLVISFCCPSILV